MARRQEATGRMWKLTGLGCFLLVTLGVVAMVGTGSPAFGWLAALAAAGLLLAGIGAWLASG
jgi:hypothetical protein